MITSSYTGTTKETVAAAEWAKAQAPHHRLRRKAGFTLGSWDYAFANDARQRYGFQADLLYQILFNILKRLIHTRIMREDEDQELLPKLLDQVKEAPMRRRRTLPKLQDEKFFFVTGSGASWGRHTPMPTYLEEMQWIYATCPFREFFTELLNADEDSPIIVMQGEDRTRPLGDRVIAFVRKYTKKIIHVDARDYELPGVSERFREFLTPIVLSAVMSVYSEHLEKARNHPLSMRRYMFKVEY
jgi:fructoselysine-6-P-deglycase FrlB-like protein